MAVSGGSPSFTTITTTSDASISGLTVGKGGGTLSSNTAVGASAMAATATGQENSAFGNSALKAVTSGQYNTGIGYFALSANTSASSNTGIGDSALRFNTTGASNSALGESALNANTTGGYNVAIGASALVYNTTASNNTAVGYQALYNNTSSGSTAVGYQAGYSATAAAQMTAVGYQALKNATDQNTAFGDSAGLGNTSGYFNLYVGKAAGSNNGTGSYNCYIGAYGVSASSSSVSNEMVISSGYGGGSTPGKGASTGFINANTGYMYNGANTTAWSTTSDRRLKKNIVDHTEGLDKVVQIKVRNFEYRTAEEITELDPKNVIGITGVQLGVIAQELAEVLPDCVKTESTGVMSVQTDNLTWHMVNAIKDLKAELDTVKAELAALKG